MDPFILGALILPLSILILTIFRRQNVIGETPPLPPGPRGIPILGYLPFMRSNTLQQLTDLSRQFGPIYKLQLGGKLAVVITSPALVKQIVRDHDSIFAYRDATVAASTYTRGGKDLAFSPPDSRWRAMRKVLVQETQSGSSLDASYGLRKEQLRKAVRRVYSLIGERIEFGEVAFQTEVNLMMNLLWGGVDFGGESESERLGAEFKQLSDKISDLLTKPNLSDFFPIFSWLDLQGVEEGMGKLVDSMDRIFEVFVSEHEKISGELNLREGRKDFLQILLETKGNKDLPNLSRDQIKSLLGNIVFGGSDTSAATIEFAMAELLNNPDTMEKAQSELSEVVGLNNIVEESHLPRLPYLNAVIKETLRLHPPVPFLVPRTPIQTSTIGGYTIPEGTRVLINAWAMQRDPSMWYRPTEFRPDRFLQDAENTDFKGNSFHFIPFGSGRRMCPGMPLAERMVAYVLASFLHSFDWKLPDDKKLDMSETVGIVLTKTNPSVLIPTPRLSDPGLYV